VDDLINVLRASDSGLSNYMGELLMQDQLDRRKRLRLRLGRGTTRKS
jgi:hypothetical protein